MARRAKDYQVTSKTARSKLIPREKPYYRQLAPRVTLGYIRRVSGPGSSVRRENIGPGKFVRRTTGTADVDQRAGVHASRRLQRVLRRDLRSR